MNSIKKIIVIALFISGFTNPVAVTADQPFVGEIRWFAGNFAPRGWAFCDGSLLPISSNTALFSILGTTYGGDGRTTFGLPDMRGRIPVHPGRGPGLATRRLGGKGGVENTSYAINNLPAHKHTFKAADSANANSAEGGNALAPIRRGYSAEDADVAMAPGTISSTGGSTAGSNMGPYTSINCIIAIQGIFPSRS